MHYPNPMPNSRELILVRHGQSTANVEGIWQGHLSLLDKDPAHNTSPDMIANLGETADCAGHWIKASVESNGRFTVTNSRNGFSKTYTTR